MKKLWTIIFILSTLLMLSSCQETAPRSRELITSGNSVSDDNDTDDGGEQVVEDPTRPTGQIVFKKDRCICQAGKSTVVNDCTNFCANKLDQQEYLYAEFTPGLDIVTNQQLQNTRGWCSNPILNDNGEAIDGGNASCALEYTSSSGATGFFDAIEWLGDNSLRINVSGQMIEGSIYLLTLKELSSGAKTNTVQLLKGEVEDPQAELGPLKISPVNQYTCMSLGYSQDEETGDLFLDNAYPLHFYYVNSNTPPTVPPNVINIYCHDIQNPSYTRYDKPEYPRLELVPGTFNFWGESDPRFYDTNQNTILDVHEEIKEYVDSKNGTYDPSTQQIFFPFSWPNFPYSATSGDGSTTGGQTENQFLGYIMTPWIDQSTFKAYCPNDTHYYSNNPVFQAMRDLIGVNTEGLYMAIKETETTTDENGNVTVASNDYLLIREGMLKKVWFYYQNGQKFKPTNENVGNLTVHFYWPPDPNSPFIKKSNQRLYTVRHPQDLSGNPAADNQQLRTNLRPHDKRFACIPAIEDPQ